jgi:uncharacterized membrane protein YfcA
MDYLIVILVALAGSCLSFFSGFGLGTLLLPAFLLFFPIEIAVAATAVVHMLNNVFKLFLVGKYADWKIVRTFGLTSIVGALLGAWLLGEMGDLGVLTTYKLWGKVFTIEVFKLIMAILIATFTIFEAIPRFKEMVLPSAWLPVGGLISGFFGGLSGHQGALRSAFLIKAGLSKESFMGSRVVIAMMVDTTRIFVYAFYIKTFWNEMDIPLISLAAVSAFSGAWLGNKWMKSTTLEVVHAIVTATLLIFAVLLGAGII